MTLDHPHHRHIRINYRVFTVLVLVAWPLLAIGGLVVIGIGQAQSRDTFGAHLEQIAERTAAAVDTFVLRRIIDVSLLARVPGVQEAAVTGGRTPFDIDAVRQIDRQWLSQQPARRAGAILLHLNPAIDRFLNNAASRFFREVAQNDPIYSELLLTDAQGRLVAASNVTSDYFQADEEWWLEAFNGRRPYIGDVQWDESAQIYAIEISVPVFAPGLDDVTGVLKAVTNSREMLATVSGVRFGETGEAVLVRKNGSLVYSRRGVQPDSSFFAAALLRESLGLTGAPIPGPLDRATDPAFHTHFSAQMPDGSRAIVAVAPTQLGISYPNLPWLVAVYEAQDELFAPMRAQIWYFFMLLILVTVAVLVFALWFSMRLAAPQLDNDMHLVKHARVHQIDDDEEAEAEAEEERERQEGTLPQTSTTTRVVP